MNSNTTGNLEKEIAAIDAEHIVGADELLDEPSEEQKKSLLDRAKKVILPLSLGAFVVSAAYSAAFSPLGEIGTKIEHALPWAVGGFGATEAMFIGGVAMMGAVVGLEVRNPFKVKMDDVKDKLHQVADKANESKVFQSGMWINTAGAIGSAGIIIAGAVAALPEATWPSVFTFAGLDIASTVAIRLGIYKGIKNAIKKGVSKEEAAAIEQFIESKRSAMEEVAVESKEDARATSSDQLAQDLYVAREAVANATVLTDTTVEFHNESVEPVGNSKMPETKTKPEVRGRVAELADIQRLVDLDLSRFKSQYGETPPTREEVADMFERRMKNAGDFMFVVEVDGVVEGFTTAFRTNKPLDQFKSWEESTNFGTLDGVVDPNGNYGYIANLTMNPIAMQNHGDTVLFANLYAKAVKEGLEYGYFTSRMPQFKTWLKIEQRNSRAPQEMSQATMDDWAQKYAEYKETPEGRVRFDHELRMYDEIGLELGKAVPHAFVDDASMDYGVVCKVPLPETKLVRNIKPIRYVIGSVIKALSRYPKLIERFV